jgi:hypothetical protein
MEEWKDGIMGNNEISSFSNIPMSHYPDIPVRLQCSIIPIFDEEEKIE